MSLSSTMTAKAQELSSLEHGKLSATVEAIGFLILAQRKGDSLSPQSLNRKQFMCVHSLSCVWLLTTPRTVAHQAPLSMGLSRQENWSGLPCPPLGNLPNPGIKPEALTSLALEGEFFTTSATWETQVHVVWLHLTLTTVLEVCYHSHWRQYCWCPTCIPRVLTVITHVNCILLQVPALFCLRRSLQLHRTARTAAELSPEVALNHIEWCSINKYLSNTWKISTW